MNDCCSNKKDKKILEELAEMLKAMAEPNRLKILCLLSSGEKCVCKINEALCLKQNLTSHHLKVLKDYKLIDCEKDGQWKIYSLNKKNIKKYASLFNKLLTN
ncbi:MAG: metalloregulator ArsR/SmtB family transcription factor [Candidatus Gracilibacteria bacterium]|jgi:ArsR family transcriptional regulator